MQMNLMLILMVVTSGAATGAPVGLGELIESAQNHQLQWQEAQTTLKRAEESVTTSRAGVLPDLSLRSSYSYNWQDLARDQESVGSTAALVSTWSIFDNGASYRALKISQLELEKARVDEHVARETASFEIVSRYGVHILARRRHEIASRKLDMLETQYRTTERQFRQGLKTRRDYQRLQTEVERAKLNLMRIKDQAQDSFEELKRYVGNPELIQAPEQLEVVKGETLLGSLLKQQPPQVFEAGLVPQSTSRRLAAEVQKVRTRDVQANLWPMVDLTAEAGYGSDSFARTGERWGDQERIFGTAQVQFHWTLFNWGGHSSAYRAAILTERLADRTFEQETINLTASFNRQRRQIERQAKSLEVVRQIFNIEQRTYRDIELEYREGRASYLDLITSLDRQTQAELDLEEETISYSLVLAERLQLFGRLHETARNL